MVTLDIADIAADFPHCRVALVVAVEIANAAERPPALEAAVAEVEAEVVAEWGETPLSQIPEIAAWRDAYKAFGIKKTSYRSSVERLIKNLQQGRGIARVSALVDAYNAISARYRLPLGADDLDKVVPPLAFRYARPGDSFIALGDTSRTPDPPKPGEVVYADAEKVLCRRWNWYQDGRSATGPASRRVALTVQSLGVGKPVEEAADTLCAWLARHVAARTAVAVADADHPLVELAAP